MHFMHRYYSYPAEMGFADGLVAQLGAQTGHNNAAFSISGKEGRPHIPIKVLGGDGQWHPNIIVLADSIAGESMLYWREHGKLRYGTMEELFLQYKSHGHNEFEVLSAAPKKGNKLTRYNTKPIFAEIKNVVYHDFKPTWKITLHNGKTIETTKDHSLFCLDRKKRALESRKLEELPNVISVDDYEFDGIRHHYNLDTITFLGLWVADGNYTKTAGEYLTGVSISTGNEINIINWIKQFCLDRFGYACAAKSVQTSGDMRIHNRQLAIQVFNEFGQVYSETKRVPEFLFIASNEEIYAFLKGYFSGDGSIHNFTSFDPNNPSKQYGPYSVIDCSSINRQLLEDISVLLDRVGIKHNITTGNKKTGGFESKSILYKLLIHDRNSVNKFVEKIGFVKQFRYNKREMYAKGHIKNCISVRGIRSIEYVGLKPVYDISVDKTEAFIANGILCHNSGNDVTLFTGKDGAVTHLDQKARAEGSPFPVQGVAANPIKFNMTKTMIQIGDLTPIEIPLGIEDENPPQLEDTLLGREGCMERYIVVYTGDRVIFVEKETGAGCSVGCAKY